MAFRQTGLKLGVAPADGDPIGVLSKPGRTNDNDKADHKGRPYEISRFWEGEAQVHPGRRVV